MKTVDEFKQGAARAKTGVQCIGKLDDEMRIEMRIELFALTTPQFKCKCRVASIFRDLRGRDARLVFFVSALQAQPGFSVFNYFVA